MVIFLYGADTFRSRQKLHQIQERFRREVDKTGYNSSVLDGRTLKLETLERDLLSAPFLAAKRLVVVEEFFAAKPPRQLQEQVVELLRREAAQASVAVFWNGELPPKAAGPLLSLLQQSPYAEAFPKLREPALTRWYRQQAKRHGLESTPEALAALERRCGDDLWRADGELSKLSAYCRGRSATTEDIDILCPHDAEESVYALTDALGQRRLADALCLLHGQLRAGTSALELTSKLAWHLRQLLLVKGWISEHGGRASSWELAEALDLHPYVAKKTLGHVGNFSLAELADCLRQLLAVDRRVKRSQGNPAALLTLLVSSASTRRAGSGGRTFTAEPTKSTVPNG